MQPTDQMSHFSLTANRRRHSGAQKFIPGIDYCWNWLYLLITWLSIKFDRHKPLYLIWMQVGFRSRWTIPAILNSFRLISNFSTTSLTYCVSIGTLSLLRLLPTHSKTKHRRFLKKKKSFNLVIFCCSIIFVPISYMCIYLPISLNPSVCASVLVAYTLICSF